MPKTFSTLGILAGVLIIAWLIFPVSPTNQAQAASVDTVYMMGRSVMEGWFDHWSWSWDDDDPVSREGYTLYHRYVDGPSGDGQDMVDSATSIAQSLPASSSTAVFFKFCFVDFEGSDQSTAASNLARNKSVVQSVYDTVVTQQGFKLIIGNALPQVSADTDSYLVWNHQQYNEWLDNFQSQHSSQVAVLDMYGALIDDNGNLSSSFAQSASDSHLNNAAYNVLDSRYFALLAAGFDDDTDDTDDTDDGDTDDGDTDTDTDDSDSTTHPNVAFKSYLSQANKLITSPASSGGPQVRKFSAKGVYLSNDFWAYDQSFNGGVRLALGDVDADGTPEIIAGAGAGGGPQVRVFEYDGTAKPIQFFAFHPDFRGGIDVAAGDTNGDGKDEIAVCQFSGGQAYVKVYRYDDNQTVVGEWNAFGSPEVGCTVAMGDIDGDNRAEVIVGAGTGGGPHIRVYEADGTLKPISFFAFHQDSRTGVDVVAADFDLDGKDEIGVSQLKNGEAWFKVYEYNNSHTVITQARAYSAGVNSGANIEAADIDGDDSPEVLISAGPTGGPHVRAFETSGQATSTIADGAGFMAYHPSFRGGVTAVGGSF